MNRLQCPIIIILMGIFFLPFLASGQSHTIPVSKWIEQIIIKDGHGKFKIEGHNKNSIIINASGIDNISKSDGLQPLFSNGTDTGLGLMVNQTENTIELSGLSRDWNQEYVIYVPQNLPFKAEWQNHDSQKLLHISNLLSHIEVVRINGRVEILNITGPLTVYSMHGDIKVQFAQINQERPISLSSYEADIEIELPENTKAYLQMRSGLGEIFTDFEISKVKIDNPLEERSIHGTINGGGVDILLQSYRGNMYIRKY